MRILTFHLKVSVNGRGIILKPLRYRLPLPYWSIVALGGVINLLLNGLGTILDLVLPNPPGRDRAGSLVITW